MPYIPNTDDDRQKMLEIIGVKDSATLFENIPKELRLDRPLDIPQLSEMELLAEIKNLSEQNRKGLVCFAGGGVYDHFIPSAVGAIVSRPEFMTAYTPYQPEVSQGTLQVIYEFQTHICRLTGMDISNASMYDGATAAAEAVVVAGRATKRNKIVISKSVNPLIREVVETYLCGHGVEICYVPMSNGQTDMAKLEDMVDEKTACVLLAQPNFFGLLEDIDDVSAMTEKVGAKFILSVDPIAQVVTKTAADYGADIAVGEGQPLGISVQFGGPLLGFFAAKQKLARSMPGRIAGRTTDVDGKTGFVLTLQTREQHIRREKATSNICTNQALCATAASVYISLMGKSGLKNVALLSMEKAQQVAKEICNIDGYEMYFDRPFVREFAIRTPRPAQEIIMSLVEKQILPGVGAGRWYSGMDDCLIIALTEKRNDLDIKRLIDGLKEFSVSNVVSQM